MLFPWWNKNMLILVQRHPFYFLFLTSPYPHNNGLSLNVQIFISKALRTSWNHKVVGNSSTVNTSKINLFSTNVQTMLNVVSFSVSTLGILLCFASTTFPSILLTLDNTRHTRQLKSEREREPNAHTVLVTTISTTEFSSSYILTEQ